MLAPKKWIRYLWRGWVGGEREVPSKKLTQFTLVKGTSSSNMPCQGDMLVAWRVCITREKIHGSVSESWTKTVLVHGNPRPSEAFQLTLRLPEGSILTGPQFLHSMLGDLPQNSEEPWIFPSRIGILSSLSRYTVCLTKNLCTHCFNSNFRMQSPRSNMK